MWHIFIILILKICEPLRSSCVWNSKCYSLGSFRNATGQQVRDLGLGAQAGPPRAGMEGGHQVRVRPDDLTDPLLLRGQFTHTACCSLTPTGECELAWRASQWGVWRQRNLPSKPTVRLVSASPAVPTPVQRWLHDGRLSLSPPPFIV